MGVGPAAAALWSPVLVTSADTVPGVKMTPAPYKPPLPRSYCCLFLGRGGRYHRSHCRILLAPLFQNGLAASTGLHHDTHRGLATSSTFVTTGWPDPGYSRADGGSQRSSMWTTVPSGVAPAHWTVTPQQQAVKSLCQTGSFMRKRPGTGSPGFFSPADINCVVQARVSP
ncbi:hypothetical protein J4Q44_G00228620 [Coregonus suidteri]|uniref:Secreted protein n=1 Tax=Coregonus suidteri TaxID=861788 RepID=A0AAN8LCX1_9TELE